MPGGDDEGFARDLLAQYNVTVLPGSYLARHASTANPGAGRIRMALVAETAECVEAARRIVAFVKAISILKREKRMTHQLETIINDAWENRANINTASATAELRQAVEHVIAELDAGRLRVATREGVGQMDNASVDQESRPVVVPSERQRHHEIGRPRFLRQGPHEVRPPPPKRK